MATNPRRIYNLPEPPETHVEIAMEPYTIANQGLQTKCGWTPFAGMRVAGRVQRVVLRGNVVYEAGQVLAVPGSGQIIRRE
jgi:carbamoyl-phosphate synthase/aspartate carbamoyltransferase/dihydroorotase